MKITAQLYNCRDYTKTPEDIHATLRRIKAIGFDVIQISGFGPCDPDLIAEWVQEIGLEVCLTHTPWPRLASPEECAKVIGEHKKMGCPVIGLGARPGDSFPNSFEGWTRFIKQANEVTARIRDAGLEFSYHNHDFEFQKWKGVTAMDRLIAECPDMLFTLDVFWVQSGGGNPVKYINALKGRIKIIHFKDFRIVNRARQFAEIGQGVLDWGDIIAASKAAGVSYAAIEQDSDWLDDPFESLAMSRDYLIKRI